MLQKRKENNLRQRPIGPRFLRGLPSRPVTVSWLLPRNAVCAIDWNYTQGADGTNWRGPAVRKGPRGPAMLYSLLSSAISLCLEEPKKLLHRDNSRFHRPL